MSKFDIDNLLNELGVGDDGKSRRPRKPALPEEQKKKHRVDEASDTFSPLPPVPGAQRRFGEPEPLVVDPAVKAPPPRQVVGVGEAFTQVYQPEDASAEAEASEVGQLLQSAGAITAEQLTAAQTVLRASPGRRLVDVLLEQGIDEERVQRVVASIARLPFERVDLSDIDASVDGQLMQRLTPVFCKQHDLIPLRREGQRIVVGATRPDDVFLLDEVRRRLGVGAIKLVVVMRADVRAVLDSYGEKTGEDFNVEEILGDINEDDVQVQHSIDQEVDLEKQAGESPVIRYVNYILQQAVKEGASDIHVEPGEGRLKVRFRIDGVLYDMMTPPAGMSAAITSRLKIMAGLDIAERRLPQDGRIRAVIRGRKLDLRVSTLPTGYGEKTVMRILDTKSINVGLDDLGFDANILDIWRGAIDAPHGIILVTGPTGSGKTTTLYASLRQMDKQKNNISTVEDPIEYHLDGITQTQTHDKIGMTFAKALKALLRQDPDIIMLGEIRDLETAHTAVQAALTGHLVLSTLHTNDAPASITRLVNIGIEPFLIGAAVNAVLAQRLVRRICPHCKEDRTPPAELAEFLELNGMPSDKIVEGKGCDKCRNNGYSGRVGIYEMLVMDDQTRDIVARNPNVSEFRRFCIERGMTTLRQDGMNKVRQGLTTVTEILRVTEASG